MTRHLQRRESLSTVRVHATSNRAGIWVKDFSRHWHYPSRQAWICRTVPAIYGQTWHKRCFFKINCLEYFKLHSECLPFTCMNCWIKIYLYVSHWQLIWTEGVNTVANIYIYIFPLLWSCHLPFATFFFLEIHLSSLVCCHNRTCHFKLDTRWQPWVRYDYCAKTPHIVCRAFLPTLVWKYRRVAWENWWCKSIVLNNLEESWQHAVTGCVSVD